MVGSVIALDNSVAISRASLSVDYSNVINTASYTSTIS